MVLGSPGSCLRTYAPSLLFIVCVIRANVFTEVPGLRGMGIRVGTDSTPLQPGGKTAKGPARKLLMPSWQAPPAMEQVPWNTCVSWMAIGSLWAPVNQASKNW